MSPAQCAEPEFPSLFCPFPSRPWTTRNPTNLGLTQGCNLQSKSLDSFLWQTFLVSSPYLVMNAMNSHSALYHYSKVEQAV